METGLLHIFRNTPLGREALLQSGYFCKVTGVSLVIYVPTFLKFLMYFENDVVQVDLDKSYRTDPSTAKAHAVEIVRSQGLPEPEFLRPKNFTSATLPDIPINFGFMDCPRFISGPSVKIGLGGIGPRLRRILKSSKFPLLTAGVVYKPWTSVAVMFGGSSTAVRALRLGLRISRIAGLPLEVFTRLENQTAEDYRRIVENENLAEEMDQQVRRWEFFDAGPLAVNLYRVPHDALVVLGVRRQGIMRVMRAGGSFMEKVQSILPNNLLIVGPRCQPPV